LPPRDFSNIFFEDLPANVQPLAFACLYFYGVVPYCKTG